MGAQRSVGFFDLSWRRSAIGVVAAVALGWFGTAPAAIADSGPVNTSRPDLVSATALSATAVEACFDKDLATTFNINDGNTRLVGYTEYRQTGSAPADPLHIDGIPTIEPGKPGCAQIIFTGPGDVRTFSRLVMDTGAVTATPAFGGLINERGSVPLAASVIPPPAGGVELPVLFGVTVNSAAGQATYTFTQGLGSVNASALGFYTGDPAGALHVGQSVVGFTPGSGTVTVQFAAGDASQLSSATRFVALGGAVQNTSFQDNPPAAIPAAGTAGTTARPDLVLGGQRVGIQIPTPPSVASTVVTYLFRFDTAVTVTNAGLFRLYDAGGAQYFWTGAQPLVSNNGHDVTLQFASSDPKADPAEITLETVSAAAVTLAGGTLTNTEGDAPVVAPADHAGLTSGPDLLSWSIDRTNRIVTLDFDEVIPPGSFVNGTVNTSAGPEPMIAVFNSAGNLTAPAGEPGSPGVCIGPICLVPPTPGTPAVTQSQNLLILHYGSAQATAVSTAIGVSLSEAAVTDSNGVPNPEIAYGEDVPAPTPPPVPVPPPPPPPTPPAGGAQPPCHAAPHTAFNAGRTVARRDRITVVGSSRPGSCSNETASDRANTKVAAVRLAIFKRVGGSRCRFMRANGTLTPARSCSDRLDLTPGGLRHWSLMIQRRHLPSGIYHVVAWAIDVGGDRGKAVFIKIDVP